MSLEFLLVTQRVNILAEQGLSRVYGCFEKPLSVEIYDQLGFEGVVGETGRCLRVLWCRRPRGAVTDKFQLIAPS
jgi:hypothetical protein